MRSEARDPQLLKGVLPMLVLALLTEADSYGYELVTRLQADGLGGEGNHGLIKAIEKLSGITVVGR